MKPETFRMKDYLKQTQQWWMAHHGNPIYPRVLSRFGVAILDDNECPIAITYLYPSQCADIVWIGFTVRDPALSAYKAGKALKLLMAAAETEIRRIGYTTIYTASDSPAMQRLMESNDYAKADRVQEYFKELI